MQKVSSYSISHYSTLQNKSEWLFNIEVWIKHSNIKILKCQMKVEKKKGNDSWSCFLTRIALNKGEEKMHPFKAGRIIYVIKKFSVVC